MNTVAYEYHPRPFAMVPPKTIALAGHGRKSASRQSHTRASEIASVTPAPLGILTATPRKPTGSFATQEEQDALRRLVEGPYEVRAISSQGAHRHRQRSTKGKEKALPSLDAPSRPGLRSDFAPPVQTCDYGGDLPRSGNSSSSNPPTSPQVSASSLDVRPQASIRTSDVRNRNDDHSPSS
jgi:hypothetical protein